MKFILRISLAAAIVLLLAGCLKINTTLNVNKDGSGTIEESVLMSKAFVEMINEFAYSFGDSTGAEEFNLFKEDELIASASNYGSDVQYVSGEEIKNEEWEGYKAVYSFKDLNKVKLEPDPDQKISIGMEEEEEADTDNEYYFFKFKPGPVAELTIDRPEFETGTEEPEIEYDESEFDESEQDAATDQFVKMMEGMTMNISLNVNGEIVESNASYVEGSNITFLEIDFGKLLKDKENLKIFKKNQPNSLEDLREMVEKVPGMKLELQKPVTVKFK